jgi:hypothetical protein
VRSQDGRAIWFNSEAGILSESADFSLIFVVSLECLHPAMMLARGNQRCRAARKKEPFQMRTSTIALAATLVLAGLGSGLASTRPALDAPEAFAQGSTPRLGNTTGNDSGVVIARHGHGSDRNNSGDHKEHKNHKGGNGHDDGPNHDKNDDHGKHGRNHG